MWVTAWSLPNAYFCQRAMLVFGQYSFLDMFPWDFGFEVWNVVLRNRRRTSDTSSSAWQAWYTFWSLLKHWQAWIEIRRGFGRIFSRPVQYLEFCFGT
jgi:hypothetical protein